MAARGNRRLLLGRFLLGSKAAVSALCALVPQWVGKENSSRCDSQLRLLLSSARSGDVEDVQMISLVAEQAVRHWSQKWVGDPELTTHRGHLLTIEKPGNETETLYRSLTLPRPVAFCTPRLDRPHNQR